MRIAEAEAAAILGCSLKEALEACFHGCQRWWQGSRIWILNMQEGGTRPGHIPGTLKEWNFQWKYELPKNLPLWEDVKLWLGGKRSPWRIHHHMRDIIGKFKPPAGIRWLQTRNSPWGTCLSLPLTIYSQPLPFSCLCFLISVERPQSYYSFDTYTTPLQPCIKSLTMGVTIHSKLIPKGSG